MQLADGLILETPEGAIVPVRAIYYVTGRAFTPRAIATAIADGRKDADHRIFETHLHAGHVDAAGTLSPAAYGELESYAEAVGRLFEGGAPLVDQIAAMPARVYVSRAQLQSLVDETNLICGAVDGDGLSPIAGDGLAPIAILRTPIVSPSVRALVLQGFEALSKARRGANSSVVKVTRRRRSSDEDQDCEDVKAIALRFFARKMLVSAMLRERDFDRYLRGYPVNKIRSWIRAVDLRSASSKPGRRWRKNNKR